MRWYLKMALIAVYLGALVGLFAYAIALSWGLA